VLGLSETTCNAVTVIAQNIDEFTLSGNKISMYPNPTANVLHISTEKLMTNTHLSIYSLTGKLIMQTELKDQTTSLNISKLKSGVYILKVSNTEGTANQRFVKE